MGATTSMNNYDAAEIIKILKCKLFGIADNKKSDLSFESFEEYITLLNEQCKNLIDCNGKYIVFILNRDKIEDVANWKECIRINCVKVDSTTDEPESYRHINLLQFMQLRSQLIDLVNRDSANILNDSNDLHFDLTASLIFNSIDNKLYNNATEEECSICLERSVDVTLPCAHQYCMPCIAQWNVSHLCCPLCRSTLESTDDCWILADAPASEDVKNYLLSVTSSRPS